MNDLVRYPFGTHSKSFYSGLPFGLFMSFAPPPVFLFFRSLRSLSFICIKREGGEKDINNNISKKKREFFLIYNFLRIVSTPQTVECVKNYVVRGNSGKT